jgi:hypothetical protein
MGRFKGRLGDVRRNGSISSTRHRRSRLGDLAPHSQCRVQIIARAGSRINEVFSTICRLSGKRKRFDEHAEHNCADSRPAHRQLGPG